MRTFFGFCMMFVGGIIGRVVLIPAVEKAIRDPSLWVPTLFIYLIHLICMRVAIKEK